MSTTGTTDSAATTRSAGPPRRRWLATAVLCLVLGACASTPAGPAAPAGDSGTTSSNGSSTAAGALTVAITEAGGDVTPNGQKIDVRVGQQVVLQVTSDQDDEIHAHTGGDGYELEVAAGEPTTGTFTLDSAGSFEVESHELGKVIVILNAR